MAAQTARVLAPAEVLDIEFRGRMLDDFAEDAHAFDERLTDAGVGTVCEQQHATELYPSPGVAATIVYLDHIAFAHAILTRAIFKHCIHG